MHCGTGHRNPRNHPRPTVGQVPPRSLETCIVQEHESPQEPKGKGPMKRLRNEEAQATSLAQEDQEDFETRNLLLPYRPPRRTDAPPVTVPATVHVTW